MRHSIAVKIMNMLKKICLIITLLSAVVLPGVLFAAGFQQFPEHHGAINDFAGVLSPGVVQSMERIAIELEQKNRRCRGSCNHGNNWRRG